MSFASLLRHEVTIEREVAVMDGGEPMLDEDGHTVTVPETVTVRALVQPKTAREIAWASEAGPIVSDHTIFMLPTTLLSSDTLIESGRRFDIQGINDAGGQGHHLEVDARLITTDDYQEGS